MQIWQQGWHQNSGTQSAGWSRARVHLDLAMSTPDQLTHSLRSTMQLHNRRFEKAVEEAQISVSLNPSSATGYLALAEALSYSDQPTQAIENAKKARRRDPNFPAPYLLVEGRVLFDLRQYQAAVETLKRASQANPANYNPLVITIASLGQLGKIDEAKRTLDELNTLLKQDNLPAFTLSTLRNRLPYQDHVGLNHLKQGLLKGQVPEW
jgi:tetratricopeptide (TPR) repeat protein